MEEIGKEMEKKWKRKEKETPKEKKQPFVKG